MGKKGNWFSALKRAFTSSSKDNANIICSLEKENISEKKKWGAGKSKHGEANSFMSREPSSIEKILGEAERELQYQRTHQEQPKKLQQFNSINEESHKNVQHFTSPKEEPPKIKAKHLQEPKRESLKKDRHIKAPKLNQGIATNRRGVNQSYAQSSAIKIQAAYRGYVARKNYRTLKGLVRLQKVMRGHSVKRQTSNTMKCMKLLVKVQSQVRARRLQMIENRNIQQQQHQTPGRSEKEMASSFSRWNLSQSEVEADEEWDDSVLTKEERNSRTRRKVEAVIKRERALAYAYSHQLLKVTPKSAHAVLTDIRSGGYPLWWNWLDRHLPNEPQPTPKVSSITPSTPKLTSITSSTPNFYHNIQNQPKKDIFIDISTPRSSKLLPSPKPKPSLKNSNKWNQTSIRDDDSLTSCPAFRPVPNYMTPTVSAKAKVRENQIDGKNGEKKIFSFSLSQSIGSFKWGKGPLFVSKENVNVQRVVRGKHRSTNSIGGVSVDSTVSLPAGVGRKLSK